jgi:hypothetical protein
VFLGGVSAIVHLKCAGLRHVVRMQIIAASLLYLCLATAAPPELNLISVKRIWGEAPHSAFGDIIRFHGRWFAIFREGENHVAHAGSQADGKLRVIVSATEKPGRPRHESKNAASIFATRIFRSRRTGD